jgi:phospholipase/lecithinase/hemolysin
MQRLVRGLILGCVLLHAAASASAGRLTAEPLLKDGDRLVFAGDSYVGQRGCTALVMDAYALHHPGTSISFRTAPIRTVGFAATGLLPFFPPLADADVLSVKPTVVMLSFGLEKISTKPLDQAYFQRWFVTPLAAIVQKLQAAGVKVILVTPGCADLDKQPDMKNAGMDNLEQYANPGGGRQGPRAGG